MSNRPMGGCVDLVLEQLPANPVAIGEPNRKSQRNDVWWQCGKERQVGQQAKLTKERLFILHYLRNGMSARVPHFDLILILTPEISQQ